MAMSPRASRARSGDRRPADPRGNRERRDADTGLPAEDPRIQGGMPAPKASKGPHYTPVSRRQDRPDAIAWLLRNHPEMTDSQIMKLVGTTKSTIQPSRTAPTGTRQNIKPVDPVSLGLCSQLDLDSPCSGRPRS